MGYSEKVLISVILAYQMLDLGNSLLVDKGLAPGDGGIWPGTRSELDGKDVILDTQTGTLRGKRRPWIPEVGGYFEEVNWFLGIPYAEPPRRFMRPKAVKLWQGVRNATLFGAVCHQHKQYNELPAKEDCLTLNIFAPVKTGSSLLSPVMVYIHGGSHRVGTGASYLGHILAQKGVVIVTINYRLDILGFLSGNNKYLPGNYGLWDQIEALRWINNNIEAFGGDRRKITIFGHSSGAECVGHLVRSPAAKGLFHQAILQSGSPEKVKAVFDDNINFEQQAREVAEVFNCTKRSFISTVHCMKSVPEQYFSDTQILDQIPRFTPSSINFYPVVDDKVVFSENNSKTINVERVMLGVVQNEWSPYTVSFVKQLIEIDKQFDFRLSNGLDRESFEKAVTHIGDNIGWDDSVSHLVKHEYTDWSNMSDPYHNRKCYIKMVDEMTNVVPMLRLIKYTKENHVDVPIYAYKFSHSSAADHLPWKAAQVDIHYVFGGPFINFGVTEGQSKIFSEESRDREMSSIMIDLWTDFAKYGDPSHTSSDVSTWTPLAWPATDYLNISLSSKSMQTDFGIEAYEFWSAIDSLRENLIEPVPSWYSMNLLSWMLVAAGGFMLLTSFVLAIVLCVTCVAYRKNKGSDNV